MEKSKQNMANGIVGKDLLKFSVDHIASFNAAAQNSSNNTKAAGATPVTLMSPDEAMMRLRQLALRQGLWTTHVTLLVTDQCLVVVDPLTNSVMEKFALSLIYRPAAITGTPGDIYDNIAVFIVLGDAAQKTAPEVHVFQCIDQSAKQLVDAVLSAKAKKSSPVNTSPNSDDSATPSWPDTVLEYEHASQRTADAVGVYERSQASSHQLQKKCAPETANCSDVIVKTVEILNRCFDEIEQFMARLQSVADAFKELEKRRRGRKKKNPLPGDGMLSLRARNPPESDFIEVLQKFKLSFNLLARLKPHIHDPNAPELVHFLFTPLSLVIEASQDPRHAGGDLVSKVVSPLLTSGAVELLRNCLTSREMELWMTMGDAWIRSREQWPGLVAPYQLRFSDGYEPEPIYWADGGSDEMLIKTTRNLSLGVDNQPDSQPSRKPAAPAKHRSPRQSPDDPRSPTGTPASKSALRTGSTTSGDGCGLRPKTGSPVGAVPLVNDRQVIAAVQNNAPAVLPKPFRAERAMRDYDAQHLFLRDLEKRRANIYQAVQSYVSRGPTELSVVQGDIVEVLDNSRNWWRVRNYRGAVGLVPYNWLQPLNPRQ